MKQRLAWPSILPLILSTGLLLTAPSLASACWLCTTGTGSSGLDCTLDIGETGGSDCLVNCKTTGGVDRCYCRTLGVCGGSNGCDGRPCPVARPKASQQTSSQHQVALTHQLYRALEASNPDVAMMLANFVRDSDVLELGLISSEPFILGEYQGLFTQTPTGRSALKETYRFEASVTQDLDGVVMVDARIFGHPSLEHVHAQIRNGEMGSVIEIGDRKGHVKRIEM